MAESDPRHNHVTRDIKTPGVCPKCDRLHHAELLRAEEMDRKATEAIQAAERKRRPIGR